MSQASDGCLNASQYATVSPRQKPVMAYFVAALSPNMDVANAAVPAYVVTLLFFVGAAHPAAGHPGLLDLVLLHGAHPRHGDSVLGTGVAAYL